MKPTREQVLDALRAFDDATYDCTCTKCDAENREQSEEAETRRVYAKAALIDLIEELT